MSMQQAESRGDGGVFGFLTAVDTPTHGLFGGYLVVDSLGRPLEFHCTAPVKVTRAALQNAASIAALFLTTECVVADKPEKASAAAGDPTGGMGGMDF